MGKIQAYIEKLQNLQDWEPFLLQESGLPGPRANLELIQAVAEAGDESRFLHFLTYTPDVAPANTQQEFLACCGTVGLGKLAREGKTEYFHRLRLLAADPRWRIRECVAMALQIFGEEHLEELITEMEGWAKGTSYEKRAAAAALCEPKLLKHKEHVSKVLQVLDGITSSIKEIMDRKDEGFIALKKGLAYCWSVAVVAFPEEGKGRLEKWVDCDDKDVNWIIKENLKKDRLKRMDPEWTELMKQRLNEDAESYLFKSYLFS